MAGEMPALEVARTGNNWVAENGIALRQSRIPAPAPDPDPGCAGMTAPRGQLTAQHGMGKADGLFPTTSGTVMTHSVVRIGLLTRKERTHNEPSTHNFCWHFRTQ